MSKQNTEKNKKITRQEKQTRETDKRNERTIEIIMTN